MKKSLLILVLQFFACYSIIQAQVQTIHNPALTATVSKEQVASFGAASLNKGTTPVILDFEGLGNMDEIMQFYNGGKSKSGYSGIPSGVTFNAGAHALIDAKHGGTGNFIRKIMPNTILFFPAGSMITLNVLNGFESALSFDYTSNATGAVAVYDGPDGTGNMLAMLPLQQLNQGKTGGENAYFDNWQRLKVAFPGMALSVTFTCSANECGFDDIRLGEEKGGKGKPAGGAAVAGTGGKEGFGETIKSSKIQTEKGNLFLAGGSSLNMSIGSEKSKSDGNVVDGSESKVFDLNFIPKAGYYFINNLVGGLYIDAEFYSNVAKDDAGYSEKSTTFIIGPFARFYVPVCEKMIPFVEGQVGFGVDNSKQKYSSSDDWYESKYSVFTYRLGGGATYFFNDAVGADLFLGYQHDAYKYKDTGSEGERSATSSSSKLVYGEFVLQLGIVVILDL